MKSRKWATALSLWFTVMGVWPVSTNHDRDTFWSNVDYWAHNIGTAGLFVLIVYSAVRAVDKADVWLFGPAEKPEPRAVLVLTDTEYTNEEAMFKIVEELPGARIEYR